MAKHEFKKGNPGGPGRPKLPFEMEMARHLNKQDVEILINKLIKMPTQDLIAHAKNPQISSLEMIVSRIIVESIKQGDDRRLNFIFERLIGKVKEYHQVDHNISLHEQIVDLIKKTEQD